MLGTDPDIEGLPEQAAARFVDQRTYQEYVVFWPETNQALHPDAAGGFRQPGIQAGRVENAEWQRYSLDTRTGRLQQTDEEARRDPGNWVKGFVFRIAVQVGRERDYSPCRHAARPAPRITPGAADGNPLSAVSERAS